MKKIKKKSALRKLMIRNIKSYNKHLEEDYLKKKSFVVLLAYCHPLDRIDFARILLVKGKINKEQFNKCLA